MPVFEKCPHAVAQVVSRVMGKFHEDLSKSAVTVDLLFARATTGENGEVLGPALKHHGYEVVTMTRVVPYKQRVSGLSDAEITIDEERWNEMAEPEQEALIDHELCHLQIKKDKDDEIRTDDKGRPKLLLKLHDHQFGWFDAVARRHGPASIEVQQFKHMIEHHRQLYFDFQGGGFSEALQVGESNGTNGNSELPAGHPRGNMEPAAEEKPKRKRAQKFSEPALSS